MKKFLLIAVLCAFVCCVGYSSEQSAPTKGKLVVYSENGTNVDAYIAEITLFSMEVDIQQNHIYTMSPMQLTLGMNYFPQYITDTSLVLCEEPLEYNYESMRVIDTDNTFYFENFVFTYDNDKHTFSVQFGEQPLCEQLPLTYNNDFVIPSAFFVDSSNNIAVFGITDKSALETQPVSLLYKPCDNGEYNLTQSYCYQEVWENYEISTITHGPIYLVGHSNVKGNSELNCFLYNESKYLFVISPYDGSMECIIEEKDIETTMPFLDTFRKYYDFFDDFTYQNGYYIASFNAFNSLKGTYAVIYTASGEFVGYVLVNETGITSFNENGKQVSQIEMNLDGNISLVN